MRASIAMIGLVLAGGCVAEVGGDDGGNNDPPANPTPTNPDDPSNPGTPGATLTPAEFLTAIGHKECDDAFTCQATFPADAGLTFAEAFGASAMACYADAASYFDATAVAAAIGAGTITFDGTAAAACIAGIPSAPACMTYWTTDTYPAVCGDAMVGTVAVGAACTIDFECAGAAYCEAQKCVADTAP